MEYVDGVIRLDNWINLDMNPQHAAAIVALRPALESLVVRASKDPETILELNPIEEKVLSVIKALCSMNACRHELEQITGGVGFQSRPRGHAYHSNFNTPPKMMRGSGGYRGSNSDSYGGNGGFSGHRGGGYRDGYSNRGYGNPRGRGNWNGGGRFRGRYSN